MSQFCIEVKTNGYYGGHRTFINKTSRRIAKNNNDPLPGDYVFETRQEAEEAKRLALQNVLFEGAEVFWAQNHCVDYGVAERCLEKAIRSAQIVANPL